MTVVHEPPFIPCVDLWPPGTLTDVKRAAYKQLIDKGDIRIRKTVYHKDSGYITVDYLSNIPHEWTLEQLRKYAAQSQGQQIRLEDVTHDESRTSHDLSG
ncbi:MAG: hypothetical protein IJ392_02415 [Clostridia bacterium]|nr:hypothetical protein [Clostridia bacterium]